MAKAMQLLASRTGVTRYSQAGERGRDLTPIQARETAEGDKKKKSDISRGIINMHIPKVHKPSPHVLRRANFTGGGFKAHNAPQMDGWLVGGQSSDDYLDYLY